MRVYVAERKLFDRSVKVRESELEGSDFHWLDPRPSQRLMLHSPDGFEWGYSGSGPAQLALAILMDIFEDELNVLSHYQDFKSEFLATALQSGFIIEEAAVRDWMAHRLAAEGIR